MSKQQELLHYKQHPTDFIHGLLSSHVYTDSIEGKRVQFTTRASSGDNSQYNEILKDWRVHKIYNKPQSDNYYGILYVNDTAKQAILAHRGTDIIGSLMGQHGSLRADFTEVLNRQIAFQQIEAYNSTKDAVDIASSEKYNLSLTGHSLGAWLAELSLYFCHMDFGYDISAGNVKAVTFDSPGTKDQMKSYKSSIKSKDTKVDISEFDIVTYLSAPNLVNICNEHVGKVYRLFPEILQFEVVDKVMELLPNFISNNRVYLDGLLAISGHTLNPMLATFDASTGKPIATKYQAVLDWPSIQHRPSQSNYGQSVVRTTIDMLPRTSELLGIVKNAASIAISKLIPTTTYGSLATVIAEFLHGNIQLIQLFETYKGIDITTHELGYTVKEQQTTKEGFSLKYKGHYRLAEVNPHKAIISQAKGSPEWYLKQLYKYSEIDVKNKFSQPIVQELLDVKEQYHIEIINGKRVVMSKSNVEYLRDQIISIVRSNDAVREVLERVVSETPIERTILTMQEEAAKWVETCSANNVMKAQKGKVTIG